MKQIDKDRVIARLFDPDLTRLVDRLHAHTEFSRQMREWMAVGRLGEGPWWDVAYQIDDEVKKGEAALATLAANDQQIPALARQIRGALRRWRAEQRRRDAMIRRELRAGREV